MRILFVSSPGLGHIFPTIPTAWALRAAGHDVLLATGGNHETAAKAGLHVVDSAPGVDFGEVFGGFFARHPDFAPRMRDGGDDAVRMAAGLFAEVSEKFLEHTVDLVRRWQPRLVVHTPLQGAGPLAAAVVGVPALVHPLGFAHGQAMGAELAAQMAEDYRRFGVAPREPTAALSYTPPSMRLPETTGWPMRYVPYNGGMVLPDWLLEPRNRPRITITLGSVLPRVAGTGVVGGVISAAREMDAEFVLALGGADLSALGELPPNVRPVDWIPLSALLAASDAAVHHGGAGTTLTTVHAGLPQLLLPQNADQFLNAVAVTRRGIGATVRPEEVNARRLAELLTDAAMSAAVKEVAAEIMEMPSPAELVDRIVALAG